MLKVALVVPFFRRENEIVTYMEYLGFSSIAAYLRENGIYVDIIDSYLQNLKMDDVINKLKTNSYDLIGFTLMSSEFYYNTTQILEKINKDKKINGKVIVGGYYTTFNSYKILNESKNIDIAIIGEGEKTILDIVNSIILGKDFKDIQGIKYKKDNKIIETKPRKLMTTKELTELPMMARDTAEIVLKEKGRLQMLSSRGCYGNCNFCGVNKYTTTFEGPKWRYREAKDVVDEMEFLIKEYKVNKIIFLDEEFIGTGLIGRRRARDIASMIIERNLKVKFLIYARVDNVDFDTLKLLKDAGLESVFLGIEFGVQRILDFYNKRVTVQDNINAINLLKKVGLKIKPGFILFEPTISLDEIKENIKFLYDNLGLRAHFLIVKLGLYKNTKAYYDIKKITEVSEVEKLDLDYGDCVKYRFKDRRVEYVYDILNYSIKKVDFFKKRRMNMGMKSIDLNDAIKMDQEYQKELYDVVMNLIDDIKMLENLDDSTIEKINDQFLKKLVFINNKD